MHILQNTISNTSDSVQYIIDSLRNLSVEKIQETLADTICAIHHAPSGFVGKPLPENLSTNPIITISLLVLFLLYGYIVSFERKTIIETTKDFFYLKERSSIFIEHGQNTLQLKTSLVIIFIGSIGLFLYSLFFHSDYTTPLEIRRLYLFLFFGIAIGALIFKVISFEILSKVFFNESITNIFTRGYFTIIFGLGLVIYPVVVSLIYTPNTFFFPFLLTGIIFFVIAYILLLYKIFQIFFVNLYSLFYIILYLCALEILPFILVFKALT